MDNGIPTTSPENKAGFFRDTEERSFRFIRRPPPQSKLARAAFWLLLGCLFFGLCAWLPGAVGSTAYVFCLLTLAPLIAACFPLVLRWVYRDLLWKVRDRLIVTYLLMGLAPIVLFVTLAGIAAYIFSGQFAIFAATSVIDTELAQIESKNRSFALHISHELDLHPQASSINLPEFSESAFNNTMSKLQVSAFRDGRPLSIAGSGEATPVNSQLPPWLKDDFRRVVLDHGKLYLRSVNTHISATNTGKNSAPHRTVVISSVPVTEKSLDQIAAGLGEVTIMPDFSFEVQGPNDGRSPHVTIETASEAASDHDLDDVNITVNGKKIDTGGLLEKGQYDQSQKGARGVPHNVISGGKLPRSDHFYDILVGFYAPLSTIDWGSGKPGTIHVLVSSRPSLLYRRLFITSLEIASFIQISLLVIASFFAILELIAFVIAMRLNRTITQSIHDLYNATREVDHGNFNHRIVVKRKDQLAALSSSFNGMTASIGRLLQEQREKERLQSELAIAQEVQANLFPRDDISLPCLELHGVCRPARTVSGDYYDFLLFGEQGLGLALGDISGKGISAALLMASLHSAVRAYRFAGQELALQGVHGEGARVIALASALDRGKGSEEIDCGEWFESPGKILALLNRHLYRSTQPEKYATLFLAHYDAQRSRLTYSNGGQLPPFVLRKDNSVRRLDCGGTVVGLIDGMSYQQESVTMYGGDILIAYSDGVTEPENEFGDFGEDRLIDIVRQYRHLPLPVISEQVMQALKNWIGAEEQPDDITLVLARQA